MKVSKYLSEAHDTDRLPSDNIREEINPRLGLAGEIGFLLTTLKKEVRDKDSTVKATRAVVKDELGDIIWYSVTIARRTKLDFQRDVLYGNLKRIQDQHKDPQSRPAPANKNVIAPGGILDQALAVGPKSVDSFGKYQTLAFSTSKFKSKDALMPYLVRIWNNAGQLLSPFGRITGPTDTEIFNKETVSKALGDIMWYVAGFAMVYKLDLDEIVNQNALKINSAFPSSEKNKVPTPLFDEGLSPLEKFPRKFNVDFVQSDPSTAVMLVNGVRIGDRLADNAYSIDGYRFHDSIHLAFAAILGWSPVIRGLLMRKRKSDPKIDEVEDGARAQIVEEMIVKISHSYAVGHDPEELLDHANHVNLNLLKDIVKLTEGLEVSGGREGFQGCKYWEWEKAILDGFKIYNMLRKNLSGRIIVDLHKRSVTFVKLAEGEGLKIISC